MSVIAKFRVAPHDFELGQILRVDGKSSVELETLVPVGEATIPLFWAYNSSRDTFLETIRRHPTVNSVSEVDAFEDRSLFKLDWDARQDQLFQGLEANDGQVLDAIGTPRSWEFEVRFPSHDELGRFREQCETARISLEVLRVYNATQPEAGPWYGLTEPQREAIDLAVERGYYDIPRRCTTKELADELGISDQAVTERLRRAIVAIVTNTLLTSETET